jgi:hypothetical protein
MRTEQTIEGYFHSQYSFPMFNLAESIPIECYYNAL